MKELRVRIPVTHHEALSELADARGTDMASLARQALAQYLYGQKPLDSESVLEWLGEIKQGIRGLRNDHEYLGELVSHYIFYWFCYTPAVPDIHRETLQAQGLQRHGAFIKQLKSKLERGDFSLDLFVNAEADTKKVGNDS